MVVSGEEERKIKEYTRMRGSGRRASVCAEVIAKKIMAPRRLSQDVGGVQKAMSTEDEAQLRNAVAKNILFSHLDEDQMGLLIAKVNCKSYSDGDTVIREGEQAYLFYIVKSGSLSVFVREQDRLIRECKVMAYSPGDSFGELAVGNISSSPFPCPCCRSHSSSISDPRLQPVPCDDLT